MPRDIAAELDSALAEQARAEARGQDALLAAAVTLHREAVKRHNLSDTGASFTWCLQLLEQVCEIVLEASTEKLLADTGAEPADGFKITVTPGGQRVLVQQALELSLGLIGGRVTELERERKSEAWRKLP